MAEEYDELPGEEFSPREEMQTWSGDKAEPPQEERRQPDFGRLLPQGRRPQGGESFGGQAQQEPMPPPPFGRAETLQLQKLQGAMTSANEALYNGEILPEHHADYLAQINQRMAPLLKSQQAAQDKAEREATQQAMKAAALQESIASVHATRRAKSFPESVAELIDPLTGDRTQFFQSAPGKWAEVKAEKVHRDKERVGAQNLPKEFGSMVASADPGAGLYDRKREEGARQSEEEDYQRRLDEGAEGPAAERQGAGAGGVQETPERMPESPTPALDRLKELAGVAPKPDTERDRRSRPIGAAESPQAPQPMRIHTASNPHGLTPEEMQAQGQDSRHMALNDAEAAEIRRRAESLVPQIQMPAGGIKNREQAQFVRSQINHRQQAVASLIQHLANRHIDYKEKEQGQQHLFEEHQRVEKSREAEHVRTEAAKKSAAEYHSQLLTTEAKRKEQVRLEQKTQAQKDNTEARINKAMEVVRHSFPTHDADGKRLPPPSDEALRTKALEHLEWVDKTHEEAKQKAAMTPEAKQEASAKQAKDMAEFKEWFQGGSAGTPLGNMIAGGLLNSPESVQAHFKLHEKEFRQHQQRQKLTGHSSPEKANQSGKAPRDEAAKKKAKESPDVFIPPQMMQ